jgi:hypothetical protein
MTNLVLKAFLNFFKKNLTPFIYLIIFFFLLFNSHTIKMCLITRSFISHKQKRNSLWKNNLKNNRHIHRVSSRRKIEMNVYHDVNFFCTDNREISLARVSETRASKSSFACESEMYNFILSNFSFSCSYCSRYCLSPLTYKFFHQ